MDTTEFEAYYEQFKDKIYSYLYYRSGRNREMAEDLTSEVFMKALEKFHTYKKDSSFQAWIYAIAHNHLIDHFRKNKTTVDLEVVENILEDASDATDLLEKRIASEQVATLLQHLSDEERDILLMRYHQEMPMKEIAEVVDRDEGNIRVIIHRALAKLKKKYGVVFASFLLFLLSVL